LSFGSVSFCPKALPRLYVTSPFVNSCSVFDILICGLTGVPFAFALSLR